VRAASVAGSASSAGRLRIATLTGVTAPAFHFGVGDLPLLVSLTKDALAQVSAGTQPGMASRIMAGTRCSTEPATTSAPWSPRRV
jgi:hypothetical protein